MSVYENISLSCSSNPISEQKQVNLEDKQYAICQEKGTNATDRQSVAHCCVDDQNLDWKNKKQVCPPFIIKETEDMGMGWFATRDLEPGCILLEELPAIQAPGRWWPKKLSQSRKCLTCGITIQTKRKCSSCFWPVCSDACEKNPLHKENECKELVSRNVKYPPPPSWPIGTFIMCLRADVLKTCDPEKFGQLMALKEFDSIPLLNQELQNDDLPPRMLDVLRGPNCLDHDEFRKLLRINLINCFEVEHDSAVSEPGSKNESYLTYLKVSRINNSCFPNCDFTFSAAPSYKIKVFTSVPVAVGEQLNINYYDKLTALPTSDRQITTTNSGFICKCKKCLDPTELGSFISGIKCFKCSSHLKADLGSDVAEKVGFLNPADPFERNSAHRVYKCHRCHVKHPFWKVLRTLPNEVQVALRGFGGLLIDSTTIGTEFLESLLQSYDKNPYLKDHLHQNHWLIQTATRELTSKQTNSLESMKKPELTRHMERLEFLLRIDDQLFPGFHVIRYYDLKLMKRVVLVLKHKFGREMDWEEIEKLDWTFRNTREELSKFANLGY